MDEPEGLVQVEVKVDVVVGVVVETGVVIGLGGATRDREEKHETRNRIRTVARAGHSLQILMGHRDVKHLEVESPGLEELEDALVEGVVKAGRDEEIEGIPGLPGLKLGDIVDDAHQGVCAVGKGLDLVVDLDMGFLQKSKKGRKERR